MEHIPEKFDCLVIPVVLPFILCILKRKGHNIIYSEEQKLKSFTCKINNSMGFFYF